MVVEDNPSLVKGSSRPVSDVRHGRRVFSIASGTLVSRLTGLVRVLVLAYVLGYSPLADAFNLANTVPNMLFDIVLGGIASATFIPVFIERLAKDGERHAWRSISTVLTASVIVLVVASALAWILAPEIINAFTVLGHRTPGRSPSEFALQRGVSTTLLRWFVPQIFFYGMIALATALLNIRHKFAAPAWTAIANNIVCIGVLLWFHLVDPAPTLESVSGTSHLAWLGLGTTLGVVIQALLLVPSLARADLWRISLRLDLRDPALRAVGRLGSWTLMLVLANQVALYVVLAFAFGIGGDGPISAYTYGWSFMQMPYAVVVVSVLNAMTPQLSSLATANDEEGFVRRLALGLRQSLAIIIPLSFFMMVLAQPLIAVLTNHANASTSLAAGTVLAILAAGLPGFTIFQVAIRGLQSRQRARDTFFLYVFENALNVLLALAIGRHSLAGLTASVSLAYSLAAVAAVWTLHHHGVSVWTRRVSQPATRSLVLSLAAALAAALAYSAFGYDQGLGLLLRLAVATCAGLVVYGGLLVLGQRRADARSRVSTTS